MSYPILKAPQINIDVLTHWGQDNMAAIFQTNFD